MNLEEYDALLARGRGEIFLEEEKPLRGEDLPILEGKETTVTGYPPEVKVEELPKEIVKYTVPHPLPADAGKTAWYYPDSDTYRSDGSDGRVPGQLVKTPVHPEFEAHIIRNGEMAHAALQKNRDKKRAALERGVRNAVAKKSGKAIDSLKDEEAIEFAAEILTDEIILNSRAPARERWQFFVKMLEVNGVIESEQNKGSTLAIQVNVDPTIGQKFK